jgi:hypothetical protein
MGGVISKASVDNRAFRELIDMIVSKYIMTSEFSDYIRLTDPKYCSTLPSCWSKFVTASTINLSLRCLQVLPHNVVSRHISQVPPLDPQLPALAPLNPKPHVAALQKSPVLVQPIAFFFLYDLRH